MREVVDPNDVKMRQFQATLRLTLKLIQQRTILDHQIGNEFQCDIALQLFIVRQPDNPHSTPAQNLDQCVPSKGSLSADKLTRCRCCDTARALVSHLAILFMLKMERKIK